MMGFKAPVVMSEKSSGYSSADTKVNWKFGGKFHYPKKLIKPWPPVKSMLTNSFYATIQQTTQISQGFVYFDYWTRDTLNGFSKIMENSWFLNSQPGAVTVPNTSINSQKYLMLSNYADMMLTNASLAAMELHIYEYTPRNDTSHTFGECATDSLGGERSGVYHLPGNNFNTLTEAAITYTTWGWTPYMSPYVTTNYKIRKPKIVKLAPGETHHHKVFMKYGKMWNNARSAAEDISGGSKWNWRGWSCGTLVVFKGTPCSYSGLGGGLPTSISINELRGIVTQTIVAKHMAYDRPHVEFANAVGLAVGNEQLVDEAIAEVVVQGAAGPVLNAII